jgi:hypothetical protein
MNNIDFKNSFDVFINSDDCTGTNTNFNVNLVNNTNLVGQKCYAMVKDIQVPIGSIYQIKSTDNFSFSVDGVSTLSFDFSGYEGTYTITSLTNFLKSQMESVDTPSTNVYTFTYSHDRNKISFSATFSSGPVQIRAGLCSDTIQKILGIETADIIELTTSGDIVEFPQQCDFYPYYNYYLCSSLTSQKNCSTNSRLPKNIILKMHQHTRFTRSYLRVNDLDPFLFYVSNFPNSFNISIIDSNGESVSIPSNLNVELTLRIYPIL